MNAKELEALEGLVGRELSETEAAEIDAVMEGRNDVAIAQILSRGRQQPRAFLIGFGAVLAEMVPVGGEFLDKLVEVGQTDRDVYWAVELLRAGQLNVGHAVTQFKLAQLKQSLPAKFAAPIDKLMALGVQGNPINYGAVSDALNIAQERMTL